ncbi:GntR family transcriptional regulator [Moorella sp. ACPs]|jgi:DNA-binding GntR family transcriptional regulator|uniref:GntR family transcriptional regulator n=1 Tax=Neomoorella carbonis TaxID=3062783 RepID=UPI0032517C2D
MGEFQLERRPVHEQLYDFLRNAILNGEIKPGERLLQDELAKRFGISRMPVRDVLRLLEADKLVVRVPNKGVTVAEFGKEELKDTFFVRSILEREAVKLAIPNITKEDIIFLENLLQDMDKCLEEKDLKKLTKLNYKFHKAIYKGVPSQRLLDIIKNLWDNFPRYAMLSTLEDASRSQDAHRAILEAIKKGDSEEASKLMESHILAAAKAYASRNENEEVK